MNRKSTIECLGGVFYETSSYSEGLRFKVFWITQCWDVGLNVEETLQFYKSFCSHPHCHKDISYFLWTVNIIIIPIWNSPQTRTQWTSRIAPSKDYNFVQRLFLYFWFGYRDNLFVFFFEQETFIIKLHKHQLQHSQKQLETLLIEVFVFVSLNWTLRFVVKFCC